MSFGLCILLARPICWCRHLVIWSFSACCQRSYLVVRFYVLFEGVDFDSLGVRYCFDVGKVLECYEFVNVMWLNDMLR